ncbi:hypothetical protein JVT61DRAFT_669 [Boletus reticuloceps]|uniref:FMN-dependent dehydrogenase domain-containing protein n=1 Tax=Boletus reticuloceps TaxID=495285 RepID=A0A8I2Z1F8_9AGAM|nr:hypothetical protein JVT61DRAFT_669 [Boletus reticuloceps]
MLPKVSIVLKGVATPEDALMRYDYGLAGIVLLNHSGWRLVTARPGIKNLVEIVEALKIWGSRPNPKLEVFADDGPSAVHRTSSRQLPLVQKPSEPRCAFGEPGVGKAHRYILNHCIRHRMGFNIPYISYFQLQVGILGLTGSSTK